MTFAGVALRPASTHDLAFITALERRSDHVAAIGQWTDAEHARAIARRDRWEHWIVEREAVPAAFLIAFDGRDLGGWIYVKRLLVGDKDRGTGTAAVSAFLDDALRRDGARFAWLNVRRANDRAIAVYRKLGFVPFEPTAEEAARFDATGDGTNALAMTMRLEAGRWLSARGSPAR